jgi:hypothetical protein
MMLKSRRNFIGFLPIIVQPVHNYNRHHRNQNTYYLLILRQIPRALLSCGHDIDVEHACMSHTWVMQMNVLDQAKGCTYIGLLKSQNNFFLSTMVVGNSLELLTARGGDGVDSAGHETSVAPKLWQL